MKIQHQPSPASYSSNREDERPAEPLRIGGVTYPPYLILWDSAQEGEAAVRARLVRGHSTAREREEDRDRALAARLLGTCRPLP